VIINGRDHRHRLVVIGDSIHAVNDLGAAFDAMPQKHAEGLAVFVSPTFNTQAERVADLAAKHRLATISEWRTFVAAGGLVSCGAGLSDTYRRGATYVDKILQGAKPADLPVETSRSHRHSSPRRPR
jgi:putative tryptophan/tyrosine transport system substrate-binding protein